MATILEFPKERASSPRESQTAALYSCANVVLFPGVRYEYWEPSQATQATNAEPPIPAEHQ